MNKKVCTSVLVGLVASAAQPWTLVAANSEVGAPGEKRVLYYESLIRPDGDNYWSNMSSTWYYHNSTTTSTTTTTAATDTGSSTSTTTTGGNGTNTNQTTTTMTTTKATPSGATDIPAGSEETRTTSIEQDSPMSSTDFNQDKKAAANGTATATTTAAARRSLMTSCTSVGECYTFAFKYSVDDLLVEYGLRDGISAYVTTAECHHSDTPNQKYTWSLSSSSQARRLQDMGKLVCSFTLKYNKDQVANLNSTSSLTAKWEAIKSVDKDVFLADMGDKLFDNIQEMKAQFTAFEGITDAKFDTIKNAAKTNMKNGQVHVATENTTSGAVGSKVFAAPAMLIWALVAVVTANFF